MQFEYSDGDNFKAYFKGRKSHWIQAVVQYNPLVRPYPTFCTTNASGDQVWPLTQLYHVCFFGRTEFIGFSVRQIDDPSLGMEVVILMCSSWQATPFSRSWTLVR